MIRMIEDKDIEKCLKIYNYYIETSVATFEIKRLELNTFTNRVHNIRKIYPWIVYEEDGVVLGYAYLSPFNERLAYQYTCDLAIYVDHDAKGKGIGKQLMLYIIDLAKRDGYKKMTSLVTIGNKASEHLHKQFHFDVQGVMENVGYKFDTWLGIKFWTLTLTDDALPNKLLNLEK